MQITVYTAPQTFAAVAYATAPRNRADLIARIETATASVADVRLWLKQCGPTASKLQLAQARYALARARYRAGESVTLEQLAALAEVSKETAAHYLRKINKAADHEAISNQDASAVLCNIVEF